MHNTIAGSSSAPADVPDRDRDARRMNRASRALFRVFGPAQLGDPHEPPPAAPGPAGPCPRCGAALAEHVFVQTDQRKRLVRCPQ